MRIWWYLTGKLSAEIVMPHNRLQTENEVIFLSAGNLAQPWKAFQFMQSVLRGTQYAFLRFRMIGWSARATAKAVAQTTRSYDRATMYAISVGDHVARHIESLPISGRFQIYTINPCPNRRALRSSLRFLLTVSAPILWVFCHLIGWLSIIPLIPATGGKYSLVLLADQYVTIAFDTPPLHTSRTKGVILSTMDELLDNGYLRQTFADNKITNVPTRHGDTVGMDSEYLRGVEELLELQNKTRMASL